MAQTGEMEPHCNIIRSHLTKNDENVTTDFAASGGDKKTSLFERKRTPRILTRDKQNRNENHAEAKRIEPESTNKNQPLNLILDIQSFSC